MVGTVLLSTLMDHCCWNADENDQNDAKLSVIEGYVAHYAKKNSGSSGGNAAASISEYLNINRDAFKFKSSTGGPDTSSNINPGNSSSKSSSKTPDSEGGESPDDNLLGDTDMADFISQLQPLQDDPIAALKAEELYDPIQHRKKENINLLDRAEEQSFNTARQKHIPAKTYNAGAISDLCRDVLKLHYLHSAAKKIQAGTTPSDDADPDITVPPERAALRTCVDEMKWFTTTGDLGETFESFFLQQALDRFGQNFLEMMVLRLRTGGVLKSTKSCDDHDHGHIKKK